MRVLLVILTFEPDFVEDPTLLGFYRTNFDSLARPKTRHNLTVVISDFKSSRAFKAFLRDYVTTGSEFYLLDGEVILSGWKAFNIALRNFDFDVVIYSASDLRARDRGYLDILMAEFSDPEVHMVFPTVTSDGIVLYGQTQPGPLERDSDVLRFPAYCNMHFALFHRKLFEPFGMRYIDVFDGNHTESFLAHQLAATDGIVKLCYRVNLIHERFTKVRHDRTSSANWKTPFLALERRKFRELRRRLPVWIPSVTFASPVRWLLKQYAWLRDEGFMAYAEDELHNLLAIRRFRAFATLPRAERLRLVREHLFLDEFVYSQIPFKIVNSSADQKSLKDTEQ